jgi:hypothetical protein
MIQQAIVLEVGSLYVRIAMLSVGDILFSFQKVYFDKAPFVIVIRIASP